MVLRYLVGDPLEPLVLGLKLAWPLESSAFIPPYDKSGLGQSLISPD
jgi:hypothetical protein